MSFGWMVLILAIALFLRLYAINWGIPLDNKHYHTSFHPDETYKLKRILAMDPSTLDFNPHWFVKGTMQFYVIGTAIKMASYLGVVKLGGDQFYTKNPKELGKLYLVGRLVTVIMSIASIYFIFIIGKGLFNQNVGLLSAFFTSILPAHVVNSVYMKTDIPMTFWILVTFILALKIKQTGRLKWYVLTGLSIGFATATKYTAAPAVFILLMSHYLFIRKVFYSSDEKKLVNKCIMIGLLSVIFGFLIGCPYSILALREFASHFQASYSYQTNQFLDSMDRGPFFWQYLSRIFLYGMGLPFMLLSYFGIIYILVKRTKADLFILSFVFPYFLLMSLGSWTTIRYSIPLMPFFMIMLSRFIHEVSKSRYLWGLNKKVFIIIILGSIFYTGAYSFAYVDMMSEKDNRIKAWDWIETHVPEGSKVAFISHYGGDNLKIDFYYPPIDEKKYKVIHTPDDVDKIKNADYAILSEFEYRQYLRLSDQFPTESSLLIDIMNGNEFIDVGAFEEKYDLLGFPFPHKFPPHDWLYPNPTIMIYKRAD